MLEVPAGWLDANEQGRITGAAGLSLTHGPHRLEIGDASFRTWCAYDALGIPAALNADGEIRTDCGRCGAPIELMLMRGVPERSGPERLWLADGAADLRGSFCTPTVLLCSDEHGAMWDDGQGGHGQLLDLLEASRRGAVDWADCAAAAAQWP